jgi:hypothetical protein
MAAATIANSAAATTAATVTATAATATTAATTAVATTPAVATTAATTATPAATATTTEVGDSFMAAVMTATSNPKPAEPTEATKATEVVGSKKRGRKAGGVNKNKPTVVKGAVTADIAVSSGVPGAGTHAVEKDTTQKRQRTDPARRVLPPPLPLPLGPVMEQTRIRRQLLVVWLQLKCNRRTLPQLQLLW